MIELAAATWDLPLDLALRRLANAGMPIPPERLESTGVERYRADYIERRQKLQQLWRTARRYLFPSSVAVGCLQYRMGISNSLSDERWRNGPGSVFGAVPINIAQDVLVPGNVVHFPHRLGRCGRGRLGVGKGWGDLLAIPYYDLPGRICGFEFIGRQAAPEDRFYYSGRLDALGQTQLPPAPPAEAGLAGAAQLLEPVSLTETTVLAVADASLLLRLQARHFHTSLRPLPIVAWRGGLEARTVNAWASFMAGKRVVFWTEPIDAATIAQAMAVDGWLTGLDLDRQPEARHQIFRRYPPLDLARRLFREARPWANALPDLLRHWSLGGVETLLARLQETGADMEQLARQCPTVASQLADLPTTALVRQVWLGNQEIQERAGRWYLISGLRREASLLLDGQLRLDRIEMQGETTRAFGSLVLDDTTVPVEFDVTATITPGWLSRLCIRHGRPPVYCRRGWSHRLVEIASPARTRTRRVKMGETAHQSGTCSAVASTSCSS